MSISEKELDYIISEINKDEFFKIIQKYQTLVNLILEYRGEDGICRVTQAQLGKLLNYSPSRVSQMINSINTEEICIEKIKAGSYRIVYESIFKQGTFNKLLYLYFNFLAGKLDYNDSYKNLSEKYNIKIKTVQMFKSYMRYVYFEACKDNKIQ